MKTFLSFIIATLCFILLSSVNPISAQTTTPTPTPLPKPTEIIPSDNPCGDDDSVYPPNSECYPEVEKIEEEIEKYPITCITAPEVTYEDTFLGEPPPTVVDVTVTHDISQARLGGYGPDSKTMSSSLSPDTLAKNYLFNSLFDKPFYSLDNTPREAWRTYWRLLSAKQQANVKSAYLNEINNLHKNVYWHYYDKDGNSHETNAKELRSELRVVFRLVPGCLLKVPVCDNFSSAYHNLSESTKNKYDSLLPYDFDNLRSFIVLGSQVSKENIPYLEAILSGIAGERGLFSHLTPGWSVKNPEILPTTKNEGSLMGKLIARAASITCSPPQKSSSRSSPRTYPSPPALSQTVPVPVSAVEIYRGPPMCYGSVFYCDYFNTQSSCELYGCTWDEGEVEYELSGSATGSPLAVFNNPKVDQITDMVVGNTDEKIPSFYRMMLPDYARVPEKVLISAPSVSNSSDPPAQITGANTIWRENNLAQDTMHLLQSCWLIPSDGQSSSKCGKKQEQSRAECDGELMKQIVGDPPDPSDLALSYFSSYIQPNLIEEVINAYSEAEAQTGVPCEVLAGIHFEEGGNDPNKSLQDGSPLTGTLVESAINAANELKGKAGGTIADIDTLVRALSYYNGGGNTNCQDSYDCPAASGTDRCGLTVACYWDPAACVCRPGLVPDPGSCRASCDPYKFPYTFSYSYCPQDTGYADPYVTNWWQSPQHDEMYLLYQYDCTRTRPFIHLRPGSLTVALSLLLQETE